MSARFPSNTKIKDFAYPETDPLHFGILNKSKRSRRQNQDNNYDSDLTSNEDEDSQSGDDTSTNSSSSCSSSTSSTASLNRRTRHHYLHNHHHYHNGNNEEMRGEERQLGEDGEEENEYETYDLDDVSNRDGSEEYLNDEINCKARAIFEFKPENDNEIELIEGQIIWISYRHGQGWLVAEDPETGENGLVPEEYVEFFTDEEEEEEEEGNDIYEEEEAEGHDIGGKSPHDKVLMNGNEYVENGTSSASPLQKCK
ncbi:NBP2 [Candida pseudojiufengensis]|uniref:NBP2 n=1 Tax=Candida pseudojiufengensis TaxID=497109 RepID=UPI00222481A3|nr:NBP2 [Candida pseudojiufengensis]KAI5959789.1 NBP2 [Candida pseudojiufengensis]